MGIADGVFSKAELNRLGVSRGELRTHLTSGSLVRLRRGWYLRACEYDAEVAERMRRHGFRERWASLVRGRSRQATAVSA